MSGSRGVITHIVCGLLVVVGCGAAFASDDESRLKWIFGTRTTPTPPTLSDNGFARNPIDQFILAKQRTARVHPVAEADRPTLLRRATHDLTGLMPTSAELAAFLADPSPDAYEKAVDRLLASPRFGERWAQHWLDLVRYSETEGFKLDSTRPNAWRYRDYVIRAFNTDLPYDRFLRQQLAGDELEPNNPDAQIATGFLRMHPEETNGSDYVQIRQDILNDLTDTFGTTVLGLTLGCARCHNHKADPISQVDYFAIQSFFVGISHRDDIILLPPDEAKAYRDKLAAWESVTRPVRDQMDAMVRSSRDAVIGEVTGAYDATTQQAMRVPDARRTPLQRQLAQLGGKQTTRRGARAFRRLDTETRAKYDQLVAKLAEYDTLKPPVPPMAMGVSDLGPTAPPVFRLAGGNLARPKEEIAPRFPTVFGDELPPLTPRLPEGSTGRRAALAEWVTDPDHPLTARVMVNRLWQHYFGRGIVATPSDFGLLGTEPTHPEFLDWLAGELIRQKWSLKAIHRMIVTSATYRLSSDVSKAEHASSLAADPDNRLYWHTTVRRRDGESLRDVALQSAGVLNLKMGGLGFKPELPRALAQNRYAWLPDADPEEHNRRSIYLFNRRNFHYPLFRAFDAPNRNESCAARITTVSPQQALELLNGDFLLTQARTVAGAVLESAKPDDVIGECYRRIFGRDATAEETALAEDFLDAYSPLCNTDGPPAPTTLPRPIPANGSLEEAAALVDFVHALMNSAEFLYVE